MKDRSEKEQRLADHFLTHVQDIEQLRRAEEEVRQERDRAQQYLDIVGVMVLALDRDGKITLVNREGCRVLGMKEKEILGRNWIDDFIPPGDRQQVKDVFARIIAGTVEFPRFVENRVLTGSGEERLIAWHNTVVRDAAGSITGTLSSGEDITERKRAEEALGRSEAFLNSVIEQSPYSTWISDEKGTLVRMNQACRELLKISDDEVVNKYNLFRDNIVEQQGHMGLIRKVFREGQAVNFQVKYDTAQVETLDLRTPTRLILEVSVFPIKDTSGEVTNAVVQHLDVTERERVEEELSLTERMFRTFFENAPIGKCMTAPDGKMLQVNPAFGKMLGYREDEMESIPFFTITHPDDVAGSSECIRCLLAGERDSYTLEKRYLHKDGHAVWTHVTTRLLRDQDGNPVHFLTHILDITERKKAEEEIGKYRDHLEVMVEKRTVELTAANRELEAFAYSVSHDLRAPLRGIDGFSKALLDDYGDKLDDTGKDYINRVRAGTQRMGKLIDDILNLSRMTRSEMKYQHLNLEEMARKIVAELKRHDPGRSVEFRIDEGLEAHGDHALVETALTNLLRNAWKFTGERDRALIEVGVTETGGERAYLVRDNGAGFDMAYADKLFAPFQRLHDTTEFPGTGIGLAIVHRVVLRHGGRIWAQGEVDGGATFYFTLPNRAGSAGG